MNARLRELVSLAGEFPFFTSCVMIALLGAGIAGFFYRQLSELQYTHDRVRKEGEVMLATIKSANTLRSQRDYLDNAVQAINNSLVTEDNLAENLGYFYKIEDQTHARITDLHQTSSNPLPAGAKLKTVPVVMSITGSFAQVAAYLRQIEIGPRLIKISSFSFHRSKSGGDSVALDLTLDMLARS
jgi:Tfp pilus assembly protein PilO